MSPIRWAISGLLVFHLAAMALGAIPAPSTLRPVAPPRYPTDDALAARATPLLDKGAALVYRVSTSVWRAIAPLPQLARLYLKSMGMGQQWTMFWEPPKQHEYVRMRYYVGRESDPASAPPQWVATELVFPLQHDDEFRFVRSYWYKFRDKTLFSAVDAFLRHRDPSTLRPDTKPSELPDDLVPVDRYFSRRFAESRLTAGERLLRTEVWYGSVPVPPRGTAEEPSAREARLDALHKYYDGPLEEQLTSHHNSPYYAFEREGGITWVLEYFAEP